MADKQQKFSFGEIAIINDKIDECGKISVKLGRSEFVYHPENWGSRRKPQFFYEILEAVDADIELSYVYVPETELKKQR